MSGRMTRRLPRILLHAVTAVSFALCVVAIAAWTCSGSPRELGAWAVGRRCVSVVATDGHVKATVAGPWPDPQAARTAAARLGAGRIVVASAASNAALRALHVSYAQSRALSAAGPDTADARAVVARAERALDGWAGAMITEPTRPGADRWGTGLVALERGQARLPARSAGGPVSLGPAVPMAVATVPCWLAAVAFGVTPAIVSARLVRRHARLRRYRRAGRCPACGYDLRATPGRCPECGTVPASAVPPA
jgi:hypothetical protein